MFDFLPDSMGPASMLKNMIFKRDSKISDSEVSENEGLASKLFGLTPASKVLPDFMNPLKSDKKNEKPSNQDQSNQEITYRTPSSAPNDLKSIMLNNLDNSFEDTEAKIQLLRSSTLAIANQEEYIDEEIMSPEAEKNNKKLEAILKKKQRKQEEAEAKSKVEKDNSSSIFADILANLLDQSRQSDENIRSIKENQDQIIRYVKTHKASGGIANPFEKKEGDGFFKGVAKFAAKIFVMWALKKMFKGFMAKTKKGLEKGFDKAYDKMTGKDKAKAETESTKSSKSSDKSFKENAKTARETKSEAKAASKAAKVGRGIQTVDDFKKALTEAKGLKTAEVTRLSNNPMCKYILQGGRYASSLIKILAPIVGVFAYLSSGDEMYLDEDEDVNPRIKLNFAINETIRFVTFGLLGSDSIWELPVKDLSEFMPEDIRNGTLQDQIDYIDNYVRICIDGTYGQNGLKPDPKVMRSIFARFDEWKEFKLQEDRLANGNYTIEDTNKHKELYDTLNVMQDDSKNLLRWNVTTFVNDERTIKEFKEGNYNQRTLEYAKNKINEDWYEKLPDNIIHKEMFKKDEVRDWDYISKLDKSKINYLRNSGNLKESDNVLLDKIYENVGTGKDIYTITNEAIQEQQNYLDYESGKEVEERDESRIAYHRENILNLNKRQDSIVKDAYDRNLTDVIKAMEAKEAESTSVINSHEQRLLDLEKIINQANEEKRQAYLKAHPEAAEIFTSNEELDDYIRKNEVDAAVEKALEKIKKAEEEKQRLLGQKNPHDLPNSTMPSLAAPNLVTPGASASFSSQFSDISKYSTQMPRYAISNVKNQKSNENPQQNIRTIYKRLRQEGFTHEGAVGLMGNLFVESAGMYANIVQGGMGRTSNEFRDMLDQLVNSDLDKKRLTNLMVSKASPFRSIGYGLAQWTTGARKAGLVLKAREKGTSVSDINTQLDWLMDEFNTDYKGLKKYLSETNDIEQATRRVMTEFERPADQSEGRQRERIGHSNGIDDFLKKEGEGQEGQSDTTEVAQSEEQSTQSTGNVQASENISKAEVRNVNETTINNIDNTTINNQTNVNESNSSNTANVNTSKNDTLTDNVKDTLAQLKNSAMRIIPTINNNVNVNEQTKQTKPVERSLAGEFATP